MNPLTLLTPLFFAFELAQLYAGERYLGIKQIRVNADPRELPMPRWLPRSGPADSSCTGFG